MDIDEVGSAFGKGQNPSQTTAAPAMQKLDSFPSVDDKKMTKPNTWSQGA